MPLPFPYSAGRWGPPAPFGLGDVDNSGEVTIDPRALTVRIYDASGTLRFQHMFAPDDPS
jgi:hypothetical protein